MLDKSKLGTRYTCFSCGTKFYDLNRPVAECPECGADQEEAPVRDIRSLLSSGKRTRRSAPEPEPEPEPTTSDEDEDEDDLADDDDSLIDDFDDE